MGRYVTRSAILSGIRTLRPMVCVQLTLLVPANDLENKRYYYINFSLYVPRS